MGARDRDERAEFDRHFDLLFPLAMRVARRLVLNQSAAEDIAAEAMARAYHRWGELSDTAHAEAWVARVATNLSLDLLRKRPPPVAPPADWQIEDLAVTRVVLAEALQRLPRRQREVVVLRYIADLSEIAVAEELGIDLATVKVHTRRAIARLREMFDESGPTLAH